MGFRYGFKAEANRIAISIRKKMGLKPIDPINPFDICDHFDIGVIKLSSDGYNTGKLLSEDNHVFSATVVPCGGQRAIVYNDSHSQYRQNSSICHELAHCFLGHECTPPLTKEGERVRDGGIEAEANWLGGTLLLTDEGALHILKNGFKSNAQDIYGISKTMLNFRLKVSGAHKRFQRFHY